MINIEWSEETNRLGPASYIAKVGPFRVASVFYGIHSTRDKAVFYTPEIYLPGIRVADTAKRQSSVIDAKKIAELAIHKWFAAATNEKAPE
jgi:hypothetical protein